MNLILRSPVEEVYSRAHWMYETADVTTFSSCAICTANALSGSTCSQIRHFSILISLRQSQGKAQVGMQQASMVRA